MKPAMVRSASMALCMTAGVSAAAEQPAWISEGPFVEQDAFAVELPIEVLATKLFVEVQVGGVPRRFLFDTGSPSMLSADLAKEMQLEVIDRRQGRDSHGAIIDTAIVQSDLVLGGTEFRKVPLFVAEFPHTARCLFDGVIGSEMLPLCAWQIDLPRSVLRCNTDVGALDHVAGGSRQVLHDFGYPHAPILDVQFSRKASSKALFDTGSPEYFVVSPPDFEGARRGGAVDSTVAGHGSLGGSLGGVAPEKEQRLVALKQLSIGSERLGRVVAPLRESAPSLIGASLLEHYVVTLDARSASAYFDRYRDLPLHRRGFGFGLSFEADETRISLVWEQTPAASAGVQVGQRVQSINGQPASTSCDGIRSALRAISADDAIVLGLDGVQDPVVMKRPASPRG